MEVKVKKRTKKTGAFDSNGMYIVDKSKPVKVDLGCGVNYYKGENHDEIDEWIHVDGDRAEHIEIVTDFYKDGIPLETGIVDEAHCSEVIEHIAPWQEEKIMSEFNRIMKIGCRFFGTTPNLTFTCREFYEGRMDYWHASRNLYGDGAGYFHTHYRNFTMEELDKFLVKYGFDKVDYGRSPGLPGIPFWLAFETCKIKDL